MALKSTDSEKVRITGESNTTSDSDITIVDFAHDDASDPLNWPSKYKWTVTCLLAFMTFVVNTSTVICAPAAPLILDEFGSDSFVYQTLLVSIWELGEVVGPLLFAPCSELYGRRIVYTLACALFIAFSLGCAASTSLSMLIAFRFLNGMTAPIGTLNAPIVADMFVKEERGKPISMVQLPGIIGVVVGPLIGSYITANHGWRWTFWLSTILCGSFEVVFVLVYRESYRVVVLQRHVNRLRQEKKSINIRSKYETGRTRKAVFSEAIFRPFYIFLFSPVLWLMGVYVATVYGYLYLILTTIGEVFQGAYGFSINGLGVVYLGIGLGMLCAILLCRSTLDRSLRILRERSGVPLPEHRLPPMLVGGLLLPTGLFMYGWSVTAKTHAAVPIVATGICGFGLTVTTIPASTYVVDAFGVHTASALASMTILKYGSGAILPLIGPPLYRKLGLGWGNSVLGFIALVLAPIPLILLKFGQRLRKRSRVIVTE